MNLTNYPVSRIKNLKITSSKIDYIVYFSLIALFFARFLNLPSTFLSLVGVYFFLAVPYVIGKSLCIFFENSIMKNFGFILTIFIETVFGMLFTVVLFALIQSISLSFIIIDAIPILVGICIAINISANFVKRQPHQIPQIHNDAFLKYFLLSVVASIERPCP